MSEEKVAGVGAGRDGKAGISAELLASCYDDVRRIARGIIARDGPNRPLQATELANEAAIRLIGLDRMEIRGKGHMLALAARTMRRIMIDEARKGGAAKRHMPTLVTRWPDDPAAALMDAGDLDRACKLDRGSFDLDLTVLNVDPCGRGRAEEAAEIEPIGPVEPAARRRRRGVLGCTHRRCVGVAERGHAYVADNRNCPDRGGARAQGEEGQIVNCAMRYRHASAVDLMNKRLDVDGIAVDSHDANQRGCRHPVHDLARDELDKRGIVLRVADAALPGDRHA